MAYILLLETATEICSVGISQGGKVLASSNAEKGYQHSERLTILIEEVVKQAEITLQDLSAVAISKGPGSYTALRIGTSTAKGICYALNLPLIAIDTLTALAYAAYQKSSNEDTLYCPMIDARRMEVYTCIFDAQLQAVLPAQSMIIDQNSFEDYFDNNKEIIFIGNGAQKCQVVLTNPLAKFEDIVCDAQHLAVLAAEKFKKEDFEEVAYFVPTYGKAPNITKPKKVAL